MPIFSQLDSTKEITETQGAITLITQKSGAAGHSMIGIEYLNKSTGKVEHIVAHLVALPSTNVGRPTQQELMSGSGSDGNRLKTRILIQREGDLINKIASKMECKTKTWSVLNQKLNPAMLLIGEDASLSDSRKPDGKEDRKTDYQNSPNDYIFMGKLRMCDPGFGINCANWAISVLKEAGITGVQGYFIDVPRSLTSGGHNMPKLKAKL